MTAVDLTSDLDVLFRTIAGEAENQPLIGKEGVAASILKRASIAKAFARKQFGDGTIRGACLAPSQYSCWLPGPDHDRIVAIDPNNLNAAQQECLDVAQAAIAGTLQDPTGDATHYYAKSIPGPLWLPGAIFCCVLGDHIFWKGVR